jgi:tight adherence protein B
VTAVLALIGVLAAAALARLASSGCVGGATRRRCGVATGGLRSGLGRALGAPARRARARASPDQLGRVLSEALEQVARAVRGGASLHQAITAAAAAGPAAAVLADVAAATARGQPLAGALQDWPRRHPRPEVVMAAAGLALAASAGGSQARAVDALAATIRERLAVAADVRVHSAQARLSAVVIALLPLAFVVWAALTDPSFGRLLVASPAGWACVAGGLTLDGLGALWMRHLLRSALR